MFFTPFFANTQSFGSAVTHALGANLWSFLLSLTGTCRQYTNFRTSGQSETCKICNGRRILRRSVMRFRSVKERFRENRAIRFVEMDSRVATRDPRPYLAALAQGQVHVDEVDEMKAVELNESFNLH